MADGAAAPIAGTPYNALNEYSVNVPHVIINQVFGGGVAASTGVYLSNGFIELYNQSDNDINLNGWSLQYNDRGTSATTGAITSEWKKLDLTGTIKAHSSFLITGAAANVTANAGDAKISLAGQADQTWDTQFINNKGMKVVLMSNQSLLAASNANPFNTKPEGYVDMVGTGSNDNGSDIDGYEAAYPSGSAEGTSKKKAIRRKTTVDGDNNKTDFQQIDYEALNVAGKEAELAAALPHNSEDGPWGVTTPEQPETPEIEPVIITTTAVAGATIGTAYTAAVAASGGTAPYSYSVANLPAGLTLDSATGVISGTPTAAAKSSLVTVTVTDSANPALTATKSYWLTIGQALRDMDDTLSIEKIGSFSLGITNKDGGVAEIVKFNKDNNKFYLVNGSGNPPSLEIVSLGQASGTLTKEKTVLVKDLSETNGFVYGDLTSVDINTTTKRISVSVQEKDPLKPGKILVLDYNGNYVTEYGTGVQPDMIKSTEDGRYVLTADEAEPRLVTQDAKGSITVVDTVTGTSSQAYFDDPSVIEDGVHIRGDLDTVTNTVKSSGSKEDALYDLEPEYITLSTDGKTAYVTLQENNAVAVVDIATHKVTAVKALGLKNYNDPANALDVQSNGAIQLETVPFNGMYMPDGAASYTVNGKTYLLTANEGDASEFRVNASTVGALKGSLDPESEAYKFLKDTTAYDAIEVAGDMGNDGIYMYGGRSFSIWSADTMDQVYDSGNDFETITAERVPDYFNVSNSKITMDDRSVKKGPEPEDIKVGKVGSKELAFIGLERTGGFMTYDVTNPEQPKFANYTNTRVYKGSDNKVNLDTDTGPEGIEFIPASVSPTGQPLLLVAYEVGGKVGVYQLNVTKVSLAEKSLSLKAGGATGQLTATVVPANGGSSSIVWSSSNSSVASVDQNGKVTPLKAGTAVITATSADGYAVAESTVTVAPVVETPDQPSNGGSNGGGSVIIGDGSSEAHVVTKVDVTMDGSGKAHANVTNSQFTSALKKLRNESAAGQSGSLTVSVVPDSKAKEAAVVFEKGIFAEAKDAALSELIIEAGVGTVAFDAKAIASLATASKNNDVTITVRQSDAATAGAGLSGAKRSEFLQAVGSHPVFDFTVKANGSAITTFGGGTVHVQVPYTPGASEDRNAIIVYYISDSGELVTVPSGVYNSATGMISFDVTHFSRYAVAYNKKSFKDTTSSFAKDAITYLSARSIISGTSSNQFSPKTRITRADFTVILCRIAGSQLSHYKEGKFSDVRTTDYYADAVQWAADKGITSGVGGGKFNPKASITRAEMAAMLVRFAGVMNFSLPANEKAVTFADSSAIQASVKEAVKAIQQAGIIHGKTIKGRSGVYFAPKDFATREETAKMLAVFMQLMNK